jgi:hypothetical protein
MWRALAVVILTLLNNLVEYYAPNSRAEHTKIPL